VEYRSSHGSGGANCMRRTPTGYTYARQEVVSKEKSTDPFKEGMAAGIFTSEIFGGTDYPPNRGKPIEEEQEEIAITKEGAVGPGKQKFI